MVEFIDAHRGEFGVEPICRALQFAPSTYYDAKSRPESQRARRHRAMGAVLVSIWAANWRVYGARKLWVAARRAGHDIGRDQVARLMRAAGISGATRQRRVHTTKADPCAHRPGDLVRRDFTAAAPNRLWVTDLTVVPTGEVLYDTKKRHTAKDVLAFFKWIDLHVPKGLDVQVVLDNLSAHKAPEVNKWLAHPRRKRWHLHFTPTSSWLNLVEGWFHPLTERRLRRGTFNSVDALVEAIELWAEHWNDDPKPFVWKKTADEIIKKVRRGRTALTEAKSATDH